MGSTGDDVTMLVRALADGVPQGIDPEGRVEVRGELVMLRSTFAACMPQNFWRSCQNSSGSRLRCFWILSY